MGKKLMNPKLRKISLTLSVPFHIWEIAKAQDSQYMVDLIQLGLWAKREQINVLTLEALRRKHEDTIMRLQARITKE